ncbi:hypothetical protein JTE90_004069 [Oedothorax gibbosus]|uniref:RNA methyltransferase n=1 Tax=Oedothorax gibbosus TaxID=931172 RepID=A0AAV6U5N1_9ARAC|nr:hypothetical protein JTE90_004069 [Oedothorax gibbosus]
MPSSPIQGFSMADNTTQNSFECTSSIASQYDELEGELKNGGAYRFNHGHALLRQQIQHPIILQAHKTFSRRRFTFSGNQEQKVIYKKRRRFTSVALPTKFLLGGNINDPLNLGSLQDEKINQKLNEFSPASSPMPMSNRRTQVQVMIPPNIYDPLNLNTGEDIEFNLLHSKPRKRRRHRKGRKEDDAADISPTNELPPFSLNSDAESSDIFILSVDESVDNPEEDLKLEPPAGTEDPILKTKDEEEIEPEKTAIGGSPCKTIKKTPLSKSISRDDRAKSAVHKQAAKHRKTKVKQDTVKFRANAEKFCYGNHVMNKANWHPDGSETHVDHRLGFLDERFFHLKDVLDIGSNTGELSLYIASHCQPKKVVGIDIDKKLVNKAQRTIRLHLSQEVERNEEFPTSMAAFYGPLSKIVQPTMKNPCQYPNNITFLEANYVPASEDFLETQKPEYDTILCLRVTKWIHLNFGDDGLKMAFKRMFAQLRYGGVLILEPQPWFTYAASKKITPAIYNTYQSLKLRPDKFCNYLLSNEVGFSSCQELGKTFNYRKGYRQNIFILKKENPNTQEPNFSTHLSPIPFHYDMWNCEQQIGFPTFEDPTDASFSDFERQHDQEYAHFDGNMEENFSSFDRHEHEDYMNFENDVNEEFVNLEHSNECFSDCDEHSNEVFLNFES